MYRLTVVAGPGCGTSFKLADGENSIGRQLGNNVVLPSSQVSKRHCVLVASNGELVLRDDGSANGTFVNGVLTRSKRVKPGDRIGVGEFVLELVGAPPRALPPPSNVVELDLPRFPRKTSPGLEASGVVTPAPLAPASAPPEATAPKDLVGKVLWSLENYLMPIFYGMNLKSEWRWICAGLFGAFLLANLAVSIQPLLQANAASVLQETLRRASFMASDIAQRNAAALQAGTETKTEIGPADKADGVEMAMLTDLDLRIIAPANRMNQYLTGGPEARYANRIATQFRNGRETGARATEDDAVVAIEPVKVFDPRAGKNSVIAMAVVSIDASTAMMGAGDAAIVYSETLIYTAMIGALLLFVLYRLTIKRFQILNEDMDKALKGEIPQVTHEFKMDELNSLWDLINSALQRIPRAGQSGDGMGGGGDANPEQFVGPVQMMADAMKIGVVVCGPDRRIAFMNGLFEELSGIRVETALGQELSAVGRDQSLGVLAQDLFDRATVGGEGVSEDYEFSGIGCQVMASAFGNPADGTAKAYVLAVIKKAD